MKRFKNFIRPLFGLALAAGLVLNFGGCLNDAPVAPEAKSEYKILVLGTGNPSLKKVVAALIHNPDIRVTAFKGTISDLPIGSE